MSFLTTSFNFGLANCGQGRQTRSQIMETGKEEARLFADDMIMQAEGMHTNTQAIRLDELVHRYRIQKQYIRIRILCFVFLYPRIEQPKKKIKKI